MSNQEVIMLVGGAIAVILGIIDFIRAGAVSLTTAGVIVLGVVFILLAIL